MAYYHHQFKNFTCLLMVLLAMALFIIEGSLARPLPDQKEGNGCKYKTNYSWGKSSELAAMLPKGPVPPSGPSLGIN